MKPKEIHYRLGLADIKYRARLMTNVLNKVKEATLKPDSVKKAPRFSQSLVCDFLDLTRSQMLYGIQEGKFPAGERTGSRTLYTIEEIRAIARAKGLRHPFAEGNGISVTVANFKGGVAKTSTTVTLAQYLSLRGYNVCVIDMDPQASTTTLFGLSPYLDVNRDNGIDRLISGECDLSTELDTVARQTYWPGVRLVAANQLLYGREFGLAKYSNDYGSEVFTLLNEAIRPLRKYFDVILTDTQPALSFLTSEAIYACEHLLITVPPSNLDFASSVIFWSLMEEIVTAVQNDGIEKYWEAINILMTRVDEQDKSTKMVRQLLAMGCEDWLHPDVIPSTKVATSAASEFATVYDIERYEGSSRSIKRARELFDKAYAQVLATLTHTWNVMQHPENYDIRVRTEEDYFPNAEVPVELPAVDTSTIDASQDDDPSHMEDAA
jgi:chromosome partitioning protein